jgi:hypothetical protein
MTMDSLTNLIDQSDLTLIGYTYKDEKIKDALLSKINPISIGLVKTSFDIKQHLRSLKIEEVLSNLPFHNSKILLVDLGDIEIENKYDLSKIQVIKRIIENLKRQCIQSGYKAIITSPLYKTMSNDTTINNFPGHTSPMYTSDLVIKFENGDLKIMKNRYGKNFNVSNKILKKLLYI